MKFRTKLLSALMLMSIMLLPTTFYAQKGKDKDHDHDHKGGGGGGKIKFKGNGNGNDVKIKIDLTPGKGKGGDDIKIKAKGGDIFGPGKGFGHPGKGHAYGKYKWVPSKDIKHARGRYRDQLRITISLVRALEIFLNLGRDRHRAAYTRFDLKAKNGKIDIKVKERRAARLKLIDIKMKELDDLTIKSKVKLKI